MSPFHRILILSLGMSLSAMGNALAYDNNAVTPFSLSPIGARGRAILAQPGLSPLSNQTLSRIRGGWSIPGSNNIMVTFGFTMQTLVNNKEVQNVVFQTMQFNPYNPGSNAFSGVYNSDGTGPFSGGVNSQTISPSGDAVTFTTKMIPNQSNPQIETTIANTIGTTGMSSLVQNNVNNQLVQLTRTYNIDISGLATQIQSSAYASHVIGSLLPH